MITKEEKKINERSTWCNSDEFTWAFWEIQRQRTHTENAKYHDIKAFNAFRWKKDLKGFLFFQSLTE